MYEHHGLTHTRIYRIWYKMKERCHNPNHMKYHLYGGRGITYCPRWSHFINFYADMKDTYQDHLTLDRIDNEGGYSQDNCRWATYAEQNAHRRPFVLPRDPVTGRYFSLSHS